jgi:hypothetical protein
VPKGAVPNELAGALAEGGGPEEGEPAGAVPQGDAPERPAGAWPEGAAPGGAVPFTAAISAPKSSCHDHDRPCGRPAPPGSAGTRSPPPPGRRGTRPGNLLR